MVSWGVSASDAVTGLNIDDSRLATATVRFPNCTCVHGAGKSLPFEDGSFDRVISAVALPYMNIQKTLAGIHRVLVPGGGLSLKACISRVSLWLNFFTIPSRSQSPPSFAYTSWQTVCCSTALERLLGS
jgi:ubiquinone/menaquinone biosynthesis C-methylase UbiE